MVHPPPEGRHGPWARVDASPGSRHGQVVVFRCLMVAMLETDAWEQVGTETERMDPMQWMFTNTGSVIGPTLLCSSRCRRCVAAHLYLALLVAVAVSVLRLVSSLSIRYLPHGPRYSIEYTPHRMALQRRCTGETRSSMNDQLNCHRGTVASCVMVRLWSSRPRELFLPAAHLKSRGTLHEDEKWQFLATMEVLCPSRINL